MASRERPWDDPHSSACVPIRRRQTWHGTAPGSTDLKNLKRRGTWATKLPGGHSAPILEEEEPCTPTAPLTDDEGTPLLPYGKHTAQGYFGSLRRHYGLNLLVLIFAVQHLMKGFVINFCLVAEQYVYRSYSVPATEMQIYNALTGLPWALKPIIGLASDLFPICGHSKAPLSFLTSALGAAAFVCVGLLPHATMTVRFFVLCLFLQTLQVTTADVLSQGKFTQKVQEMPVARLRTDLITFVWSGSDLGAFVAVLTAGAVIQIWGPRFPYMLAAIPALGLVLLAVRDLHTEKPVSAEALRNVRRQFWEQSEACILSVLIFGCAIALILSTVLFASCWVHFLVSAVIAFVVLSSFTMLLSPVLALMNAFNFIFSMLNLSIEAAAFYFFTDTVEQYSEGPHLSVFFYTTVRGAVQFASSLLGIYMYQRLSQGWTYRNWLIMASLAFGLANILNVLIFRRVNLTMHISDHAWILVATAVTSITQKWLWMPRVVSISYMSPKGMEVSMFALLMGCNNLGWAVSANFGAQLLSALGVSPRGYVDESAQFKNLWIASLWASIVIPVAVLMFSRFVPNVCMDETLVGECRDAATTGSFWRRFVKWWRRPSRRISHVTFRDQEDQRPTVSKVPPLRTNRAPPSVPPTIPEE